MERNEVSLPALLDNAKQDGWFGYAGEVFEKLYQDGTSVPIATLWPYLKGFQILTAIESMTMLSFRERGLVLLAMAHEMYDMLDEEDTRTRLDTAGLLAAFKAYLKDGHVEPYLYSAYCYRSRYGSAYCAEDSPFFEKLVDAMPSGDLALVLSLGRWSLARHWRMFAEFMLDAQYSDVIETLRNVADTTVFVEDDSRLDAEARNRLEDALDAAYEQLVDAEQDNLTYLLRRSVLPVLRDLVGFVPEG